MRLDVHNHVIPEALLALVREDPAFGVEVADGWWRGPDHVPFPIERTFHDPATRLADLERAGLEGAVISPAPALFAYRLDPDRAARFARVVNEGLAEFCAAAPERLHFLADLPMGHVELSAELIGEASRLGAVGIAVATSIAGRRLDEARFRPFWQACAERSLPVFVHPAFNDQHAALNEWYLQNVIGNPLETAIVGERLMCSGLLDEVPGITVMLVHGGGFFPYQLDRLRHASQVRPEHAAPVDTERLLGHFVFDTLLHGPQALRFLAERVGIDRLLLGTDMPFDMGQDQPVSAIADALGAEAVQIVAERNPAGVFLG